MAEKVQVNADKLKVLSAVMDKIERDFGKGSIMRMSSSNSFTCSALVSTIVSSAG